MTKERKRQEVIQYCKNILENMKTFEDRMSNFNSLGVKELVDENKKNSLAAVEKLQRIYKIKPRELL